jgi:hypothetical protein
MIGLVRVAAVTAVAGVGIAVVLLRQTAWSSRVAARGIGSTLAPGSERLADWGGVA